MGSVLENLRRLNRKERFFLLAHALDRPDFHLGFPFRAEVQARLGLAIADTCARVVLATFGLAEPEAVSALTRALRITPLAP